MLDVNIYRLTFYKQFTIFITTMESITGHRIYAESEITQQSIVQQWTIYMMSYLIFEWK